MARAKQISMVAENDTHWEIKKHSSIVRIPIKLTPQI